MKTIIKKTGSTEGSKGVFEVEGIEYEAMDCLGYSGVFNVGDELEAEFSIGVCNEDETWEQIFSTNNNKEKKLVSKNGWSYQAFGEIISINPVIVDCGVASFEDVIGTSDSRCIGEYISFGINRLDIWVKSG